MKGDEFNPLLVSPEKKSICVFLKIHSFFSIPFNALLDNYSLMDHISIPITFDFIKHIYSFSSYDKYVCYKKQKFYDKSINVFNCNDDGPFTNKKLLNKLLDHINYTASAYLTTHMYVTLKVYTVSCLSCLLMLDCSSHLCI